MYRYTMDLDPDHFNKRNFTEIFKSHGVPNTIVEIGVFEGQTTVWLRDTLSQFNPKLMIHAVDPHVGSADLNDFDFTEIRSNFIHNINTTQGKNIVYHNDFSTPVLLNMIKDKVAPEFIYIDGDHTATQVLTDLVLSWLLLCDGGVILCDDATRWRYRDSDGKFALQNSPRMAIDYFIHCNFEFIDILTLPYNHQVAFRKLPKNSHAK